MKKRKWKSILGFSVLAAVVVALIALPAAARRSSAPAPSEILSATAAYGEIQTTLAGGGALQAAEAVEVSVPEGVEITRFLVNNGDFAEAGQALAELDTATVLSAVARVQESLDDLSRKISETAAAQTTRLVSGQTEGRLKALYIQPGDDVRQVILEHGALAVISLDGLMAVEIESDAAVRAGDSVRVLCRDAAEYPARVDSALNGVVTVTLTDDGPPMGESAQVFDESGALLGSGELRVHSPRRILAADGTVAAVYVRAEQKIYSGTSLFSLRDTGGTELSRLSQKRREYEELLQTLLRMQLSGRLEAPCTGFVSGVDRSLATQMAAAGRYTIRLLADEEETVSYYLVLVTMPDGSGGWLGKSVEWPFDIGGEEERELLLRLSESLLESAEEGPIRLETEEPILPGNVYLLTVQKGAVTDTLLLGRSEAAPATPDIGQLPTGDGGLSLPTIVIPGAFSGYAAVTPAEDDGLFPLEGTTVLSVTPADTMTVTISVDELDILQYSRGMSADITVDALPGQSFTGTVTQIAGVGSNSGGSSKFAVTLELARSGQMLPGMNASVVIHTGSTGRVLTVPAAALHDSGTKSFVYTAYDEKRGELQEPVGVEIGASDGETVEIVSGLTEGQRVWYAYYTGEASA